MVNNNSDFNQENSFSSEANGPSSEANSSFSKSEAFSHMKDFGKKGLQPLFGVITKYSADINPYLTALEKGIKAAVESLNSETSTEEEREVSRWFGQASGFVSSTGEKIKSTNPTDLWHFFETEARRQPGLMFSASYVAGLVFGRLGRHVGSQAATETVVDTAPKFDGGFGVGLDDQTDSQMTPPTPGFPDSSNIH